MGHLGLDQHVIQHANVKFVSRTGQSRIQLGLPVSFVSRVLLVAATLWEGVRHGAGPRGLHTKARDRLDKT